MSNNAKYHETLRKHQLKMFWGCWRNCWKSGSRLKIRFSAQISNYAKIPWNTQKTPTKHVLRLFENFLKIWFSAQTSGSRLICRTMLKIPWNTQKTPTKHVLRFYKNFLKIRFSAKKIRFSAQMSNNAKKFVETLRKHQLNTLWGILINFWKSDSWLKNPVLGSDVE